MASKSKKCEWKIKGVDRSRYKMGDVQEAAEALREQIRALENVGNSGFKGWVQLKFGDDDKADELTLIASFSKSLAESDTFTRVAKEITKLLESLSLGSRIEVENVEVKE